MSGHKLTLFHPIFPCLDPERILAVGCTDIHEGSFDVAAQDCSIDIFLRYTRLAFPRWEQACLIAAALTLEFRLARRAMPVRVPRPFDSSQVRVLNYAPR